MSRSVQISDVEWIVMQVVWRGEPLTAADVIASLGETHDWNDRTIRTLLARLVEKGRINGEKGEGAMATKRVMSDLTPKGAYRVALSLARKSRYGEAFDYLEYSVSRGERCALYALATWYLSGRFVDKDYEKAARLLRKACHLKHRDACHDLAICYEKGCGVKRNKKKALALFIKASLAGDSLASLEVGRMYYWGIGTKKSLNLAKRFWYRAACGKLAEAEYNLGVMYEHGDGLRQNVEKARTWYVRAASDDGTIGEKARASLDRLT